MMSGILRQPMAILGALGLLSLAEDLLQWQQHFQTWIDAWQAFSRPVAMFLFGWLIDLWPWELPDWTIDYLIMGTIVFASFIRSLTLFGIQKPDSINQYFEIVFAIARYMIFILTFILTMWPIFIILFPIGAYLTKKQDLYHAAQIFLESFIWAALLIAINYAWIASG